MNEDKKLLIVLFVNDNHLSNVRSLQSIFKQDYPNTILYVINDDTDAFQSERLLYNITDHTPDTVQKVRIVENPYPIGECASVKNALLESKADYVYILHAGEIISSPRILRKCLMKMEHDLSSSFLIAPIEKKTDILNETVEIRSFSLEEDKNNVERTRPCDAMFLYRSQVLYQIFEKMTSKRCNTSEAVIPFLEDNLRFLSVDSPICFYSDESMKTPLASIPSHLGNERLHHITELISNQKSAQIESLKIAADKSRVLTPSNKRTLWLFKHSRFMSIKIDVLIFLLLFLLSALVFLEKISIILGIILLSMTMIMGIWTITMLCFNLHFRKHPERLVF